MKPQYYILGLFLLLSNHLVWAQSLDEQIIGTWIFDYESSVSMMDDRAKAYYDKIPNARRDRIIGSHKGRKVTFRPDGTYDQEMSNGKHNTANWRLSTEGRLELTTKRGIVTSFKIKELEADKLVLEKENTKGGATRVLFAYWYLKRN